MNIIVPLDSSEQSDKALDFALDFAQAQKAKVWIVHIADERLLQELDRVLSSPNIKDIISTYAEEASREIFEQASKKAKNKNVEFETYAATGNPAEEIMALAKEIHAEHVVIGNTGVGKTMQFPFGSVADKVVRNAPCSITVVKSC